MTTTLGVQPGGEDRVELEGGKRGGYIHHQAEAAWLGWDWKLRNEGLWVHTYGGVIVQ